MTNLQNEQLFFLKTRGVRRTKSESNSAINRSLPAARGPVSTDALPDALKDIEFSLVRLRGFSTVVRHVKSEKVEPRGKSARSRSDFHLEPEKKDSTP
jgi:hypothetical protein